MIGIDIPMPKCCDDCPCNDDGYRRGIDGEIFEDDTRTRRRPDCKLIDLSNTTASKEIQQTIDHMRANLETLKKIKEVLDEIEKMI